jgi:hypothetical protein
MATSPLASTIIGPLSVREAREPFVPPESPGGGRSRPASTMSAIKKAVGKRLHRSSITEVRPEGHGASAANVTSELEEAMPQHLVSTLQAAGSDQSGLTGLTGLITDIIATLGPIGVGRWWR